MVIYLIRHCESNDSANNIVQSADSFLSLKGILQAKILADFIKTISVNEIISSSLVRARQTAEIICKRCSIPLRIDPNFNERDYGEFCGRRYENLNCNLSAYKNAPSSGESIKLFMKRVNSSWDEIVCTFSKSKTPIAIVTHAMVIKAIIKKTLNLSRVQNNLKKQFLPS